ncbi:ankyrin repeat domain-containing protein [Candidatus Dependentiae bacterium]|nr:ankyrin repeat domain-containing protein [Candidatus Dependentiae bacterium]
MKKLLFICLLLPLRARAMNSQCTIDKHLLQAVYLGENVIEISRLLELGASPNVVDANDETPLHTAVGRENIEIAQLLLERGANPNATNYLDLTPLHSAAQLGYSAIAQLLLAKNANPNAAPSRGTTPLTFAVSNGRTEVTRLLLQFGAVLKEEHVSKVLKSTKPKVWKSPKIIQNAKAVLEIVTEYQQLEKEAKESPTQETLKRAIEDGYIVLIQPLLYCLKPTQEQIAVYSKIAQDKYIQTQNFVYKRGAQALREYLLRSKIVMGAITAYSRSFNVDLPQDIAKTITTYAL